MNVLHVVTTVNPEITVLLKSIETQKEELKLFQFLNGLDEKYGLQRSQLLMMSPLPSVEAACSVIQQEESQIDVLNDVDPSDLRVSAMYSKSQNFRNGDKSIVCEFCGRKGHNKDKCWSVIGYLSGIISTGKHKVKIQKILM